MPGRQSQGPSRRQFLAKAMGAGWLAVGGGFGGASLSYLWPSLRGGFGAVVDTGSVEEITAALGEGQGPFASPAARSYIVTYDAADDPDGRYAELTGGAPLMALYQRCVHLGCRVPFCASSQWFECPCHGSQYTVWGEWRDGPAPRGLDRFPLEIVDGRVLVDTGVVVPGPPRGTVTLAQPPAGPHCVDQ